MGPLAWMSPLLALLAAALTALWPQSLELEEEEEAEEEAAPLRPPQELAPQVAAAVWCLRAGPACSCLQLQLAQRSC